MKNQIILACGALLALACNVALCSDEPAREFNPKFELAYFEPTDSNLSGSIGLKYEASYTININDPLEASTPRPVAIDERLTFFNLNIYSKGNFPFKENFPVEDFIETGIDFGAQSSHIKKLDSCSDGECSNNIKDDSYLAKLSATYQFESDRDFDSKQHAYGGKLRVTYKKSDSSKIQYVNPLEWIPSAFKALIGDGLGVSGGKKLYAPKPFDEAYLPSLNIIVEQVSPEKDEKRKAIDPSLEKFERIRVDLTYSSTLFKLSESDVYRASFTFRHFQEVSPEKAIEEADLDSYSYRTFAIHTPSDVVISYSKGKLPFDAASESMFKIGWDHKF